METPAPAPSMPPWVRVALLSLGLLFVPAFAWLIIPEPEPPKRVVIRTSRTDLPRQLAVEDDTDDADPAPAPDAPAEEQATPEADALRGTVTSGESVVPNAMVTCTRRDGEELVAAAAGNGQFSFPLDAEGCSAVAKSASFGVSPPVELRRGVDNQLVLPGQGGVAGVVVDERGFPVSSFLVDVDHAILADGSRAPGGVQRRFSDEDGRFSLERLGAGTWTLLVSAPGRPATKVEVAIEGGKTTEDLRVRLERGATLVGSVVDRESRRPIGGATVSLDVGARGSAVEPATSSPGGEYRLEGVPDGAFGVEVQAPGYLSRIVSGLDARGQKQLRTTIDLAPAKDAGGQLEMSGIGASLSGDAEGQVRVTSVREEGPAARSGMLAEDVIASIDGKSAEGLGVQDCVQLLRGPAGTEVQVSVRRGDGTVAMTIVRDVIIH